jgi:hypothetical protein
VHVQCTVSDTGQRIQTCKDHDASEAKLSGALLEVLKAQLTVALAQANTAVSLALGGHGVAVIGQSVLLRLNDVIDEAAVALLCRVECAAPARRPMSHDRRSQRFSCPTKVQCREAPTLIASRFAHT